MNENSNSPDQQQGLYRKYSVERLNDLAGKHKDCTYYVLDLDHDKHAVAALGAYARSCQDEFPDLAADLRQMIVAMALKFGMPESAARHQIMPTARLIVRPLLVSGQLGTMPDRVVILIDSEQNEHEQVVALWHEVLHFLGLTDEQQIDALAYSLAEVDPLILRKLAHFINVPDSRGEVASSPKLSKPAQIGNTIFGVGIDERMVIERAQREHGYRQRPDSEAVRINQSHRFLRLFHTEGILAELVELKGMKDALDDHRAGVKILDDWAEVEKEYGERKPRAWQRARELLQGFKEEEDQFGTTINAAPQERSAEASSRADGEASAAKKPGATASTPCQPGEAETPCGAAPSSTPQTLGDAYFIVGYEDTPGFAIARSKAEVRAALCDVIYGGSLKPENEETKEELDSHMEWFEDADRWSIDRSHWSIRYEIGGIEAWRFPAELLTFTASATPPCLAPSGCTTPEWCARNGDACRVKGASSK